MHQIVKGEVEPYIFHMSWTTNKSNKFKFFQQMGQWHLREECVERTAHQILSGEGSGDRPPSTAGGESSLVDLCCSAEPILTCHYRDKPSVIPCNGSPRIDSDGKPFWIDHKGNPL